jgi:hypothetical protein
MGLSTASFSRIGVLLYKITIKSQVKETEHDPNTTPRRPQDHRSYERLCFALDSLVFPFSSFPFACHLNVVKMWIIGVSLSMRKVNLSSLQDFLLICDNRRVETRALITTVPMGLIDLSFFYSPLLFQLILLRSA